MDLTSNPNKPNMGNKETSRVLLIGGAGYVGAVASRQFLAAGYKVRVLDPLLYQTGPAISDLMENPDFDFVKGSFGEDPTLRLALRDVDHVVLLAAMVGDPICKKYPELAMNVNLHYPKALWGVMKEFPIKKFIFTSTCSNYGLRDTDEPAKETDALNPQSLYAETKIAFEQHILGHLNDVTFSPTILRISTAFGISARMRFDLTISEFSRELALGKSLLVYDEHTWRPYCHVSDISTVIQKVMEAPEELVRGEVFNTGGDQNNYTKKMIADLVLKHLPQGEVAYKAGGVDPRNYRVSFEKVKRVLGFEPAFTAEDSIVRVIEAVKLGLFDDYDARRGYYGNYEVTES
jgi:nucleoside-diphosphate-sugar epimerase